MPSMIFNGSAWEFQATVPDGTTNGPLIIPQGARPVGVSVGVFPAAGATGLVELSLSPRSEVEAGAGRWLPWPAGNVTTATLDALVGPATAVRLTATGGAVTWEVVA